jgi:hypothetical protein
MLKWSKLRFFPGCRISVGGGMKKMLVTFTYMAKRTEGSVARPEWAI